MTSPPNDKPGPSRVRSLISRVVTALGIGILATLASCIAGATVLTIVGALYETPSMLRATPFFVFYGMIFGPIFAWPVTLVALPGIWILSPNAHRRLSLHLAGPLLGGLAVFLRLYQEVNMDGIAGSMIVAGIFGGSVAAWFFCLFIPKQPSSEPKHQAV